MYVFDHLFYGELHELGICEILLEALARISDDMVVVTAILNSILSVSRYLPCWLELGRLKVIDNYVLHYKELAKAQSDSALEEVCVQLNRSLGNH